MQREDDVVEQRRKWRIERTISAGDLVAIGVAVVAVLSSYFSLDKRVAVVETLSAQNNTTLKSDMHEIKQDVRRLGDKIERYLESKR